MAAQRFDDETASRNYESNRRLAIADEQEPRRRRLPRRDLRIEREQQRLKSAMVGFRPTGGES